MNKKEAKQEVVKNSWSFAYPESESTVVDLRPTLNIIDQIEPDQPKPVVPQMIFDVIESFNEDEDYLHEHVSCQSDEVREWLTHNERDFYEAWLAYPNITVQKEKLYTVEIPNPNTISTTALTKSNVGDVVMCYQIDNYWKNNSRYQLTEAEIRKDFDWAWEQGFAKEVTE